MLLMPTKSTFAAPAYLSAYGTLGAGVLQPDEWLSRLVFSYLRVRSCSCFSCKIDSMVMGAEDSGKVGEEEAVAGRTPVSGGRLASDRKEVSVLV